MTTVLGASRLSGAGLRDLPSVHDTDQVGPLRQIRIGHLVYGVQRHLDPHRTPVRYVTGPDGVVWMVNRHGDVFRVVEKDPGAARRSGTMLHAEEADDPAAIVEAAITDGLELC
ncbi:hypothetical protein D1871_03705 [Nakamurella silvestris]|nr:hypothetical protein D1871_03705 [Nakamurella silvestris]